MPCMAQKFSLIFMPKDWLVCAKIRLRQVKEIIQMFEAIIRKNF